MLSITGLHNFYYLPGLHDMRCKAPRIFEIIRAKYHRNPLNGDVYMFMSKEKLCWVNYWNFAATGAIQMHAHIFYYTT